jgi:hypothetical protein
VEEGDCIFVTKMYPEDVLDMRDAKHLCAMGSVTTKLATTAHKAKGAKTLEESVPAQYLEEFRGVFEKKDFNKLPERRKWDHTTEPVKGGVFPCRFRNRQNWMCSLKNMWKPDVFAPRNRHGLLPSSL